MSLPVLSTLSIGTETLQVRSHLLPSSFSICDIHTRCMYETVLTLFVYTVIVSHSTIETFRSFRRVSSDTRLRIFSWSVNSPLSLFFNTSKILFFCSYSKVVSKSCPKYSFPLVYSGLYLLFRTNTSHTGVYITIPCSCV